MKGGIMDQHFMSNKADIEKMLGVLYSIIDDPHFSIKKNFILAKRKNDLKNDVYNNTSTLLLVGYDIDDVVRELRLLTYNEYYETIIDVVGCEKLLYVFKKIIQGYLIYIKFSIRNNKIIF